MNDTVRHINATRAKIKKLEKDFNGGKSTFSSGFTLDVYYGGNKEVDVSRISIGSFADKEDASNVLYHLMLTSLNNSLKFWIEQAQKELAELQCAIIQQ